MRGRMIVLSMSLLFVIGCEKLKGVQIFGDLTPPVPKNPVPREIAAGRGAVVYVVCDNETGDRLYLYRDGVSGTIAVVPGGCRSD
jgi:hypothetical protein